MSEKKIVDFVEEKGDQIRKPFVPLTGNPESHDYADWYRSLRETDGASVTFAQNPSDRN